jgi:hypothetical protein
MGFFGTLFLFLSKGEIMAKTSLGRAYFTDGHVEEAQIQSEDLFLDGLRIKCESGTYVRVRELTGVYKYYKTYVNHDWETMYVKVNNIDHVELK